MSSDDAPCKCNGTGFINDPEMDYLKSELKKACGYLRQAKIKWDVRTTNSDVDVFLEKWGKK